MNPFQNRSHDSDVQGLTDQLARSAHRLESPADLDPLLDRIGEARFVLLGEASHGTSQYYRWRSQISRRLIQEKGFSFIAVEGDWPDCYRVNRFIKGYSDAGESAAEVLRAFERWPTWMWANWEVVALCDWLRLHNEKTDPSNRVGFFGLDVYSLWESMDAIIDYLEREAPEAVEAARQAYFCFEPFGQDEQAYARSTMLVPRSCEEEVVRLLSEVRRKTARFPEDAEGPFSAEQNARVMVNAERYYRAMVRGGPDSWNIRDHHMTDTLDRLMDHHGPGAKGIVWAHNTHIGDARETYMKESGRVNVGQLARERHGEADVVLVGFGSHRGSVIAGKNWGAPMESMRVPEARQESWEDLFHRAGEKDMLLFTDDLRSVNKALESRGHRAIGVVYHPERERFGNYVPTVFPRRYDAFLYLDQSHAVHPLHIRPEKEIKPPDTYPWGL